jgi:hypothetical protein
MVLDAVDRRLNSGKARSALTAGLKMLSADDTVAA